MKMPPAESKEAYRELFYWLIWQASLLSMWQELKSAECKAAQNFAKFEKNYIQMSKGNTYTIKPQSNIYNVPPKKLSETKVVSAFNALKKH